MRLTNYVTNHCFMAFVFCALCACRSDHEPTPPGRPPPSTKVVTALGMTELPSLDESASISGVDANQNGVRDDIERLISTSTLDETQKLRGFQVAQAMQAIISNSTSTDSTFLQTKFQAVLNSIDCLALTTSNASEIAKELEIFTLNTVLRQDAYIAAEKNMGAVVFTLQGEPSC